MIARISVSVSCAAEIPQLSHAKLVVLSTASHLATSPKFRSITGHAPANPTLRCRMLSAISAKLRSVRCVWGVLFVVINSIGRI